MLEVKVNVVVTAPEVVGAINNLATAISGKASQKQPVPTVQHQASASTPAIADPAPMPKAPVQTTPTQPTPMQVQTPTVPVQQPATPVASVPLADAPQFSIEQIMSAGATLMDAGKVDELLNLLHSFGVQAVMDLKPEQLGAFATEMRKLGAAI